MDLVSEYRGRITTDNFWDRSSFISIFGEKQVILFVTINLIAIFTPFWYFDYLIRFIIVSRISRIVFINTFVFDIFVFNIISKIFFFKIFGNNILITSRQFTKPKIVAAPKSKNLNAVNISKKTRFNSIKTYNTWKKNAWVA